MISLGIDVSNIDYPNLTGIGNYTKYLTLALSETNQVKVTGSYRLSRLKNIVNIREHLPSVPLRGFIPGISNYLDTRFDIFHGPDFKIPKISRAKKVVTIPDMGFMYPAFSTPAFTAWGKKRMEKVLYSARPDSILAISEFSRTEFLSFYPKYEAITKAIYIGSDHQKLKEQYPKIYDFPYILFVGSLEKRKNVQGVLDAFELIHKQHNSSLHLVIAGGHGGNSEWSKSILKRIEESKNSKLIHYLGYTEDISLHSLYSHAACLFFPTFYEGFGIPILEAMHHGCPVVTSNVGAMKEICNTAAVLVDPNNAEEMADAIRKIQEESYRHGLKESGYLNAKKFTWKKCGEETLRVYQSLI